MATKYPIYIPTKGRFNSRLTMKSLDLMGVEYYAVIEKQEYSLYATILPKERILVLPFSKPNEYSQLVMARNWIKQHSIKNGFSRHWQIDDNINGFERLNRNERGRVYCDGMFRATEDFVDRYKNIGIAGFEYRQFGGGARRKKPPFKLNYRVYSTSLVNNKMDINWRGIYNDDTDLCLRALKEGWVTVTFNTFLQNKAGTMSMRGGNTPIYTADNRKEFAESLQRQHPDCVTVVWRYERWHHEVDYTTFQKNKLIKRKEIIVNDGVNNYGMKLIEIEK